MTYRYPSTTTVDNQLNTQIHGINAVLYGMCNRYFSSPSTDRLHSRGSVVIDVLYALEAYLGYEHSPRELVFPDPGRGILYTYMSFDPPPSMFVYRAYRQC